jgi:hypothetical protein
MAMYHHMIYALLKRPDILPLWCVSGKFSSSHDDGDNVELLNNDIMIVAYHLWQFLFQLLSVYL